MMLSQRCVDVYISGFHKCQLNVKVRNFVVDVMQLAGFFVS